MNTTGKLQPLRGVQRHQRGFVGVGVPVVGLVHQPGALQILFQLAAAGVLFVELPGVGEQFLDVGQPILVLLIIALGERRAIAGGFEHRADHFFQVAVHDGRNAIDDLHIRGHLRGRAFGKALDLPAPRGPLPTAACRSDTRAR